VLLNKKKDINSMLGIQTHNTVIEARIKLNNHDK